MTRLTNIKQSSYLVTKMFHKTPVNTQSTLSSNEIHVYCKGKKKIQTLVYFFFFLHVSLRHLVCKCRTLDWKHIFWKKSEYKIGLAQAGRNFAFSRILLVSQKVLYISKFKDIIKLFKRFYGILKNGNILQ